MVKYVCLVNDDNEEFVVLGLPYTSFAKKGAAIGLLIVFLP